MLIRSSVHSFVCTGSIFEDKSKRKKSRKYFQPIFIRPESNQKTKINAPNHGEKKCNFHLLKIHKSFMKRSSTVTFEVFFKPLIPPLPTKFDLQGKPHLCDPVTPNEHSIAQAVTTKPDRMNTEKFQLQQLQFVQEKKCTLSKQGTKSQ